MLRCPEQKACNLVARCVAVSIGFVCAFFSGASVSSSAAQGRQLPPPVVMQAVLVLRCPHSLAVHRPDAGLVCYGRGCISTLVPGDPAMGQSRGGTTRLYAEGAGASGSRWSLGVHRLWVSRWGRANVRGGESLEREASVWSMGNWSWRWDSAIASRRRSR